MPSNLTGDQLTNDLRMLMCDDEMDGSVQCTLFWASMGKKYSAIGDVLKYIFAFPNSNAGTERLFSLVKAVHTPVRNSLKLQTVNSILQIKVNKVTDSRVIDDESLLKDCKRATVDYNTSCNRAVPVPVAVPE